MNHAPTVDGTLEPDEIEHGMTRIAVASVIGTTVEWYDLLVFATASALVFNKVFFPGFVPLIGTLLAFGTFASAYLARIVGAALFGHFGDWLGRRSMLLVSLVIMGISTFCIGLLPDYASIGIWAPLLLLTLRIVQGLALGGEWGGAVLMAVEHAPASKRGLYGSWVQIGVPAGTLIANLVFLLCNAVLPNGALLAWGWRIPFLVSVLLVAVGLYVRLNTSETPSFRKISDADAQVKVPLAELLGKHWKQVLLGSIATMSTGTAFNLIVAFGLTYGTQTLGFTRNEMLAIGTDLLRVLHCDAARLWAAFRSDRPQACDRRRHFRRSAIGISALLAARHPRVFLRVAGLSVNDDRIRRQLWTDCHLSRRNLRHSGSVLRPVGELHVIRTVGQRGDADHHDGTTVEHGEGGVGCLVYGGVGGHFDCSASAAYGNAPKRSGCDGSAQLLISRLLFWPSPRVG
jgi:MFS family permease